MRRGADGSAGAPGGGEDLRNSVYDGAFAQVYATLTGGVFLTGFALHLGLGEVLIGLLAAVPFLVTVLQLPASYHVVRTGRRKQVCLSAARASRLLWVPILLLAILPLGAEAAGVLLLLLLVCSHSLGTVSYVSWLSWTTDLVPDGVRGRFFGTRNMLCGAAGMVAALFFGNLVDAAGSLGPWGVSLGYASAFGAGVAAGLLGLRFLERISEPAPVPGPRLESIAHALLLPMRDAAFRPYLLFGCLWGFSVQFASPFFNVYLLRDLGYGLGFVAGLGVLSTLADLLGMHVWGAISD
ncbi:MAG: MFS transporter, partial [Proteobacteria bacterium]|nr:MFS transporter [Pseudomonadota bacterium]